MVSISYMINYIYVNCINADFKVDIYIYQVWQFALFRS